MCSGRRPRHYLDSLPPERRGELEPLRRVWESERDQARERLITYLDGQRYGMFKEEFEDFLLTPGAAALPPLLADGAVRPARVRDVLPQVIYVHAAEVWAFDEWLRAPEVPLTRFHRLRIAAKGTALHPGVLLGGASSRAARR